jgi:quercetin dioxygenase-like cupin family protein
MEIRLEKEIIYNPVTTERLLVLESNDKIFKMGFSINPHSKIAGEHFHPSQEQTIIVTVGELHCTIDGKNHVLRAGESVTIPAGARHFQWNPTDTETRAVEEYRPAGRIHNFFRVLFKLAAEGKTNQQGIPDPLIGAALTAEFKDTVSVSSVYLRILFGLLAPFSERLGYRQTIRNYIEKFEAADNRAALSSSILMPIMPRVKKV